MRVPKLIREFDSIETLPVDVDQVVDYLRREQIKDEINFVGVDINVEILRGKINHYVIPGIGYGEPTFCADIFFDRRQPDEWQRLVCCKELLHLLDSEGTKCATAPQIEHQISRMILPNEFQDIVADGVTVITDKIATYFAVAVLFPFAARQILMEPYRSGKLTLADVARMADIPERYALYVMHENWAQTHGLMLGEPTLDAGKRTTGKGSAASRQKAPRRR